MTTSLETQFYKQQETHFWHRRGRYILAHFNDRDLVVYQILNGEEIENWTKNGRSIVDEYICKDAVWIYFNFFSMMFTCVWRHRSGPERVLAITIARKGFEELLSNVAEHDKEDEGDKIQLKLTPDHNSKGGCCKRLVPHLFLKGDMVPRFKYWIQKIEDITDFVKLHEQYIKDSEVYKLYTPRERVFIPINEGICKAILLGDVKDTDEDAHCDDSQMSSVPEEFCLAEKEDSVAEDDTQLHDSICELNFKSAFEKTLLKLKFSEPRDMILCMMGSFSPIHTRHIEVLTQSKKWIEENTNFHVISGHLILTSDSHVRRKCTLKGQKGISLRHRQQLVEIAIKEFDWLSMYNYPVGSAIDCGQRIKKDNHLSASIAAVCGADRIIKSIKHVFARTKYYTVCIGRQGVTHKVKKEYMIGVKRGGISNHKFILIPYELDDVSSTKVRDRMMKAFNSVDDDTKTDEMVKMVELGWITENVANYLLEYSQDLFIT